MKRGVREGRAPNSTEGVFVHHGGWKGLRQMSGELSH